MAALVGLKLKGPHPNSYSEPRMLAIELILRILDELHISPTLLLRLISLSSPSRIFKHRPATLQANYTALSSCSLVCRAWSAYAQSLLFHSIVIPHGDGCNFPGAFQFLVNSTTQKDVWLASCVRLFVFPTRFRGKITQEVSDGLFKALQSMQGLRYLEVWGGSCTFTNYQLKTLGTESCPKLTSLSVNLDRYGDTQATSIYPQEWFHQTLSCFPNLQFLEISAITFTTVHPFETAHKLPLVSLVLNIRRISDIEQFVKSLLRQPDPHYTGLETLEISSVHQLSVDQEASLLVQYSGSLRSIAMAFNGGAKNLQLCTRLRHLAMYRYPSANILELLPRGLEELHIESGQTRSLEGIQLPDIGPLLQEVEKLPCLQKVIVSKFEDEGQYGDLRALCRQRGIEFITSRESVETLNENDVRTQVWHKLLD
ncbi:hypothetical protein GALMADRAFT_214188 [Galerina marginata CBS 339.88]|uniref:F-box domain-containing protein n=1 Tax=Galerina marginata (strain CBS 339.88) TaxID=685588 RepID=A0A067SVI9_GALM3|nr:hypothetical protein GALMADRAFT_214188 [Galerina marginata CBS 339.88]